MLNLNQISLHIWMVTSKLWKFFQKFNSIHFGYKNYKMLFNNKRKDNKAKILLISYCFVMIWSISTIQIIN